MQSEIVKLRGNGAYDHIAKLKEMEFITSEKSGRTRLLKTTPKFYDYFDVVGEELKQKLENIQNEEKTS
jgi:segregation and condensation protein B